MRFPFAPSPSRIAVLGFVAALAGCSSLNNMMAGDKVDYRSAATRTSGLEVPPDLTQLARDGRYQPPASVVSASAAASAPAVTTGAVAGPQSVAPAALGDMHIERAGNERWLSVPMSPEELWPQIRAFWLERGFTIKSEDAKAGVMETDWAENRANLPQDGIRKLLGGVLDGLYDTGLRDRFRTRVERTPSGGSEVYISHNGLREVYVTDQKEQTRWTTRPSDPQLEAEFLARLMVRLGSSEEAARTAVATPAATAVRARLLTDGGAPGLEIDDDFDRAWRRVGLALDRTGFSVEDRNRADGVYFVRYIDPQEKPKEKGFFGRIFGSKDTAAEAQRYRIALRAEGDARTTLTIQNNNGGAVAGDSGQQIAKVLLAELR